MTESFVHSLAAFGSQFYPLVAAYWQAAIAPADTFTGWSLRDRNPQLIEQLLPPFGWFYQHYFSVTSDGWEHIPPGQVLLIGSHNGGLAAPDTTMMAYDWLQHFGTERLVYALMDPKAWIAMPGLARLAAQVGALRAAPRMAIAALDAGASLLIYPGGAKDLFRPFAARHKICLNGQHGFVKLALERKIPIVPLISYGAHTTLLVLAEIHDQLESLSAGHFPWPLGFDPGVFPIYLGLPWGLALGPLPNIPFPKPIHTRVCPPIWFERYGETAAHDKAYVEACYQQVQATMQAALDQLVAEEQTKSANSAARSE